MERPSALELIRIEGSWPGLPQGEGLPGPSTGQLGAEHVSVAGANLCQAGHRAPLRSLVLGDPLAFTPDLSFAAELPLQKAFALPLSDCPGDCD